MRDLRFSYYHTLGPKPMDPLGFLFTLVLCPGVARSFWFCSKLEAVDSADQGVGCDAVGSWHGVPSRPFGVREPCTHRLGPYVETSAGLPADGT